VRGKLLNDDFSYEKDIKGVTAVEFGNVLEPGRKTLFLACSEGDENYVVEIPFDILTKPEVETFEDDKGKNLIGKSLAKDVDVKVTGANLQNLSYIDVVGTEDSDTFRVHLGRCTLQGDNNTLTFKAPRGLKGRVAKVCPAMKYDLAVVEPLPKP